MDEEPCDCLVCRGRRFDGVPIAERMHIPIRFACEICGNKRCPHHTDHRLACTGSNASGQPGSVYE